MSERDAERTIREAYERAPVYDPTGITLKLDELGTDYADRLLQERFRLVWEHYRGGRMVDLGCATGTHLVDVAEHADRAMGVDFSARYLANARELAMSRQRSNVDLVQADARHLPFVTGSIPFLYCFSSLYSIPRAQEVLAEIGRVLAPGGKAVLDFGNSWSLNVFCLKYYTEWQPVQPLTLSEIRDALAGAGLEIIRHRRFQLLPLWADRPAWLKPLLHPLWKELLKRRVAGKMLDEWVSSLPIVRAFAFRQLIVCRKRAT